MDSNYRWSVMPHAYNIPFSIVSLGKSSRGKVLIECYSRGELEKVFIDLFSKY